MFRRFQLRRFERGSLYMILAMVVSTVFAFSIKSAMATVFLPLMVFLRFFLPFLLILPYFLFNFSEIREVQLMKTGGHLLRASFVVVSQYSLFYYFTKGSLTNGILLWNTSPLFIPIIMMIFYKHRTPTPIWMALFVAFLGVICILKPTNGVFDLFSIFGFLSGITVAFSQVLYGVNRENETLPQNVFFFFFYTSILSLFPLFCSLFMYGFEQVILSSFYQQGMLVPALSVLVASFASIGNQVLRGKAYLTAKPASLAPYIYLCVVFAAVIDVIQHPGSIHGFLFVLGMLLIFSGIFIEMFYSAKLSY